jgi:cyclopentanol dehydrogenase
MGRLEGKVAIITGGARGMGEAESRLFAKEGAKVVLTDVLEEEGTAVAGQIRDAGGEAMFLVHNVTEEGRWQEIVDAAVEAHGKVDILVNNAGIGLLKTVDETRSDQWDRVMDVNAKGVFFGCKYIVPAMQKAGGGSIVNISSMYGLVGAPAAAAYQAAKGAVRLLTKSCAVDYAKYNIRANSVHPGLILTPIFGPLADDEAAMKKLLGTTLMERPGQPDEVAYPVLFLASDESSFMTGTELVVDGGYTAV